MSEKINEIELLREEVDKFKEKYNKSMSEIDQFISIAHTVHDTIELKLADRINKLDSKIEKVSASFEAQSRISSSCHKGLDDDRILLSKKFEKQEVLIEVLKRLVIEIGDIMVEQHGNMVLPEERKRVMDLKYALMQLTGDKYKPESKQERINRGRGISNSGKL